MKKKILIAVVVYIGMHIVLSRVSLLLMRTDGFRAVSFFYIPCHVETISQSELLWSSHCVLRVLFFPVWKVDEICGGPECSSCLPDYGPKFLPSKPKGTTTKSKGAVLEK